MFELTLSPEERASWDAGAPAPLAQALRARGVDDDAAVDAAELLTATRQAPALHGRLEVVRAGGAQVYELAVGPGVVASTPDVVKVAVVATFPRLIADLVDLGPRPYDALIDAVPLPLEVASLYCGHGAPAGELDEIERFFAADYPPAVLRALLGEASTRWTLNLWAADGDAADPQVRIDVVDAGPAGLWLLGEGPTDDSVQAAPVNSTAVWVLIGCAMDAALAESEAELSAERAV
ncbi:MAG: hypothetical protein JHD16_16565 [Solirubrobacteraceae bacterium]|nr:hypothetical protein [Solirubrobacteraceae bacterium]